MDAEFDNKIHVGDKVKVKEDPARYYSYQKLLSNFCVCVNVCTFK